MRDFEVPGVDSPEDLRSRMAYILVELLSSPYLHGHKTRTKLTLGGRYSTREGESRECCMEIRVAFECGWLSTKLRTGRIHQHFARVCRTQHSYGWEWHGPHQVDGNRPQAYRYQSILHVEVPHLGGFPRIPLAPRTATGGVQMLEFKTRGVLVHAELQNIDLRLLTEFNSTQSDTVATPRQISA